MNVSFFIFFIYSWNFRWMRATVKLSVQQNSVNLSNRDLAESRETCTMWFYIHLHYVLHHPLVSVLSWLIKLCQSTFRARSLSTMNHSCLSIILRMKVIIREFPFFKREIPQQWPFLSLCKSFRGKIWEDNYRVHSSLCATLAASQTKQSSIRFCYDSLNNRNNRWVLLSTPMNSTFAGFCKRTSRNHLSLQNIL